MSHTITTTALEQSPPALREVRCSCESCGAHLTGILGGQSLGGFCRVCGSHEIVAVAEPRAMQALPAAPPRATARLQTRLSEVRDQAADLVGLAVAAGREGSTPAQEAYRVAARVEEAISALNRADALLGEHRA